jgi:hypothetical protein
MRRLLLALVGVVLATTGAVAQISIQIHASKQDFLVYEPIPITVSVHNFSGRTVQLEDEGDQAWLAFQVTGDANTYLAATGKVGTGDPVLISAGETITRTIDILPLFQIRSRGSYQVSASVRSGTITANSPPIRLSLLNGREIWKQTVGVPSEEGTREDFCTYSLVGGRDGNDELLYVRVREEPRQTMYSLIPLGRLLPTGEPQAKLDKDAHLHVLFQNAPRSYGYVEVDPWAKTSGQAAYSDFMSRPELVARDGVIRVVGGEQTYPAPEHILSEDEINPPTPPPKPKPKRKWWWPFGSPSQPGDQD